MQTHETSVAPGSADAPDAPPPLAGLLVLEITRVITGPYIGRVFADYGARVVRIQSGKYPDMVAGARGVRDPRLAEFSNYNVNKETISLNLRHPEGHATFLDLIKHADIVVENNAPGVMDRLGLGYESLRAVNPGIVMLSSALLVGPEPWSAFRGYGTQAVGLAGFQSLVGYEDEETPNGLTAPYTDFIAPPVAVTAVLAAIHRRRRTGEGAYIAQGQGQSSLFALAGLLTAASSRAIDLENAGNYDAEMFPHDCYQGSDGAWFALAVRDARDWRALASVLALSSNLSAIEAVEDRRACGEEIHAAVSAWALQRPAAESVTLLRTHDVPVGLVREPSQVRDQPQLEFSQQWEDLTDHGEPITVQNLPYRMPGRIAHWRSFASPGTDTYAVLSEILGLSSDDIAGLYSTGALE